MIRLAGVSKVFDVRDGTVEALRGIDLDVAEGEFVAVIGRSGCGKSTLLRLIAGLLPPTAGEITVAGEPVTRPRRDVAMMFQRPALLPWRTVLDNVLLPVEIFGWRRAEHRAAGPANCWTWSGWPASRSGCRTSSPAACSSGSRCAGR